MNSWEMGGILLSATSFQDSLAQGQMQRACGQREACYCMLILVPKGKKIPLVFLGKSPGIGLKYQEAQFEELPFQSALSAETVPPDSSAHHLLQAWRHPKVSHSL